MRWRTGPLLPGGIPGPFEDRCGLNGIGNGPLSAARGQRQAAVWCPWTPKSLTWEGSLLPAPPQTDTRVEWTRPLKIVGLKTLKDLKGQV
jgi:hypothetical protein